MLDLDSSFDIDLIYCQYCYDTLKEKFAKMTLDQIEKYIMEEIPDDEKNIKMFLVALLLLSERGGRTGMLEEYIIKVSNRNCVQSKIDIYTNRYVRYRRPNKKGASSG